MRKNMQKSGLNYLNGIGEIPSTDENLAACSCKEKTYEWTDMYVKMCRRSQKKKDLKKSHA